MRPAATSTDPLAPLMELPGVRPAAVDARHAVDKLLAHRVLRRSSAEVSAESALRGARASAELAGAAYQLEAVRGGHVEDPIVQGALRVSAEIGRFVDTWSKAPMQVIARLHVLAAEGMAPPDQLGRPTGDPAKSARLNQLADLLVSPRDPAVPAVVVAAIVHGELASLAPFGVADGLVARAAGRLTLVARGLDPKSVTVPEVGHVDSGREYADALAAYASGGADGVARWLVHCCSALALGAREGLAICEAVLRG